MPSPGSSAFATTAARRSSSPPKAVPGPAAEACDGAPGKRIDSVYTPVATPTFNARAVADTATHALITRLRRGNVPMLLYKGFGAAVIEGLAIYWWLRWYEEHPLRGVAVLVAGEAVETVFLNRGIWNVTAKRWG